MSNKHTEAHKPSASVAEAGKRLSGPGTRSKNPAKYDRNAHLGKAYKLQAAKARVAAKQQA